MQDIRGSGANGTVIVYTKEEIITEQSTAPADSWVHMITGALLDDAIHVALFHGKLFRDGSVLIHLSKKMYRTLKVRPGDWQEVLNRFRGAMEDEETIIAMKTAGSMVQYWTRIPR